MQACKEVCLWARYTSFYLYTPWTVHLGRVPAVKTIHNPRWLWLEVTGILTFPTDINFKRKQFCPKTDVRSKESLNSVPYPAEY